MNDDGRPRVYSYGGGVQSTAMLALVASGHLPPGIFVFSNVGDDSEGWDEDEGYRCGDVCDT